MIRRGCAAAVISACATGLAAQNLTVDPSAVRACYAAAPLGQAAPACLGAEANRCQELEGGSTTIGITECIAAEGAVWDTLLNEAYQHLRALWAPREGGGADLSGAELNDRLRDAQRAWIAFRDAECGLQYGIYAGGTIRSIIGADCIMGMTAARALALRDMGLEG